MNSDSHHWRMPLVYLLLCRSNTNTFLNGQFQHGSKWLGTLTSPILLILGPDVPPRELFKTTKNFRPRTPRGGAMPFSKFGDMAKPCTFFFKYLSIYLAGNDKLGING